MLHGDHFNWTCDICGFDDFDDNDEFFIGHRWDCLELKESKDEGEDDE